MEEVIKKIWADGYPQIIGRIVENGHVVLEDKYGNPLPLEIIDYIKDSEKSPERYLLDREISQYELQGVPVPKYLKEKKEFFDEQGL